MENENSRLKFPIIMRVILISMVPLLILLSAALVVTGVSTEKTIKSEKKETLKAVAAGMDSAYRYAYEGDFSVDENGNLYKGEKDISDDFSIVDNIYEQSGVVTTIFYNDVRMVTSLKDENGQRAVGTTADPDIYKTVIEGGIYSGEAEIQGKKYYVYYEPLKTNSGEITGMVFAGIDALGVMSDISSKVMVMAVFLLVIFIISVGLAVIAASHMSKAMKKVNGSISVISSGNLTVPVDKDSLTRQDEIGSIARSTEKMRESYCRLISEVSDAMDSVKKSADCVDDMSSRSGKSVNDVSYAVDEIASGAVSQAEDTQTAAESVDNIGRLIRGIVDDVGVLTENAHVMGKAENDAMAILKELDATASRTDEAVIKIAEQTDKTNESAKEIEQAVELITSIASQTSLLSLNASIEAARAGEAGRGFAVVASEIQQLADQSNTSAGKIQEIITELTKQSEKTVGIMKEVKNAVAEQTAKLNDTKDIFGKVREGVENSMKSIDKINSRTGELDNSRGQVVEIIQNLSAVSEENAASTQETTASTQELAAAMNELSESANELKNYADKLEGAISIFKI